jgi:hypothetical protein
MLQAVGKDSRLDFEQPMTMTFEEIDERLWVKLNGETIGEIQWVSDEPVFKLCLYGQGMDFYMMKVISDKLLSISNKTLSNP